MSFFNSISRLVKDPPPSHIFEISEDGLAHAHDGQIGFEPFPPGTIHASPVEDNVLHAEAITPLIGRMAPPNGSKRRQAAILLPDAAVRVSVLDFDSFPDAATEQASLVRFRVKKTVPFEIDSASVSYYLQPGTNRHGKKEVVAATVSLEVLARYEALFRGAGFQPGEVNVSSLATLNLVPAGEDVTALAKLAGRSLTVMVMAKGKLKLFRCITLEEATEEEILAVLHPTFAYAEDELASPVRRLLLCGFESVPSGLPCTCETLRSRAGVPGIHNAGLYGYLEQAA